MANIVRLLVGTPPGVRLTYGEAYRACANKEVGARLFFIAHSGMRGLLAGSGRTGLLAVLERAPEYFFKTPRQSMPAAWQPTPSAISHENDWLITCRHFVHLTSKLETPDPNRNLKLP